VHYFAVLQQPVQKLPRLGFLVEATVFLLLFLNELVMQQELFNPVVKLRLGTNHLNQVPFGRFAVFLIYTIQQL
jgi:hypothetical protein